MSQHVQFDVFLCHNSEDKPQVINIAKHLEAQSLKPWLDVWELPPGKRWQPILEQQIKLVCSAAVFIGSNGVGPWQDEEIDFILRELKNRNCPIIPVLLSTASNKPSLPGFLANRTWVDFRRNDPDPIQQLIWGITEKKLEKISTKETNEAGNPIKQKQLACLKEDYSLIEARRQELSQKLHELESDRDYAASSTQRIELDRVIKRDKQKLEDYDKQIESLSNKIESLASELQGF